MSSILIQGGPGDVESRLRTECHWRPAGPNYSNPFHLHPRTATCCIFRYMSRIQRTRALSVPWLHGVGTGGVALVYDWLERSCLSLPSILATCTDFSCTLLRATASCCNSESSVFEERSSCLKSRLHKEAGLEFAQY